jgi:hypothetical protein
MSNFLNSLCFWCGDKKEVQNNNLPDVYRGQNFPGNEFGAPLGDGNKSITSDSLPNSIEDQDLNTSTFGKYSSGDGKKNLNDPQPA